MFALIATNVYLMPDWTVFVQLGIFLIAATILYLLVFKPILNIFDMRRKYTIDAEIKEKGVAAEASSLEEARKVALIEALRSAQEERARNIADTRIVCEKIVADAKREAREMLEVSEIAIDSDEKSIYDEMNEQSEEISTRIVKQVLGDTPKGEAQHNI